LVLDETEVLQAGSHWPLSSTDRSTAGFQPFFVDEHYTEVVLLFANEHRHKMSTGTATVYKYVKEHHQTLKEQSGVREHQVDNPALRAATARAVERDAVTGGEILRSYRPLLFLSGFLCWWLLLFSLSI
jgi:hypothetical protein